MLIRFGVENHRSIRTYQQVSLVASPLKDENADLIDVVGLKQRLLPAIGIYGANASGKSNLLSALSFMRSAVLHSHTQGKAGGRVPRNPFALDEQCQHLPSRFDCDFISDGKRYHYGFKCDSERFVEEWLYAFPRRQRQVLFYRKSDQERIRFGDAFPGQNRVIEGLMRDNSLFISAAAQNNHSIAGKIYSYFENRIVEFSEIVEKKDLSSAIGEQLQDGKISKKIISILKESDIGVKDAQVEDLDEKETSPFAADLKLLLEKHNLGIDFPTPRKKLKLGHAGKGGKVVYFDLANESHGTRQLLRMIGPVLTSLRDGTTVIFDEIDTSLHPLLTAKILQMYTKSKVNRRGGQIIFTTHDANVLCSGILRRDQIWFTEKSRTGETVAYPLTDISTRKTDNLQKGYLQGRFGAIPFLRGLDRVLEEPIEEGTEPGNDGL